MKYFLVEYAGILLKMRMNKKVDVSVNKDQVIDNEP